MISEERQRYGTIEIRKLQPACTSSLACLPSRWVREAEKRSALEALGRAVGLDLVEVRTKAACGSQIAARLDVFGTVPATPPGTRSPGLE